MMTFYAKLCGVFLLSLLLSACGDSREVSELKAHIAELKQAASTKKNIDLVAHYQLPAAVKYNPQGAMDMPSETNPSSTVSPLQSYPIKLLQFTGVITENNQLYAYVLTPDNSIYQVKLGDIIGNSYGKIIKIDANHIEISEQYSQSGSRTAERIVTMQLKE